MCDTHLSMLYFIIFLGQTGCWPLASLRLTLHQPNSNGIKNSTVYKYYANCIALTQLDRSHELAKSIKFRQDSF